jgi:DNA-binding NarL/FixJ family response regulator
MMSPINVSIVSDVRLHCDGLATLLSQWPLINVLGAHTLAEAATITSAASADVALLDMPRTSIVRFVDALRRTGASRRVIAMGVQTASEVLTCAAVGIDGFVANDAPIGDMVSTIRRVANPGSDPCSLTAS